jgi:hypothetical protein
VANSFEENDCKNANTHAHGDVHLVVLAHLQRRWSLSGREGFDAFMEVKRLFSTMPKAKKRRRKEVTGVTGWWTRHGLSTTGMSG